MAVPSLGKGMWSKLDFFVYECIQFMNLFGFL